MCYRCQHQHHHHRGSVPPLLRTAAGGGGGRSWRGGGSAGLPYMAVDELHANIGSRGTASRRVVPPVSGGFQSLSRLLHSHG